MKRISLILTIMALVSCTKEYEIVIVGGTPGGIMSAISAARSGSRVLLLERSEVIGGLPANGLGATDISTRGATTGMFTEFTSRVRSNYVASYGEDSEQVKDCSNGYHFEPHVAESVFKDMLAETPTVKVITMQQFDCDCNNIKMSGNRISRIRLLDRNTGHRYWVKAKMFIDATYEGDLAAAAGVPFRIGREGFDEFKEPGAGKIYKYWEGAEDSGSSKRNKKMLPFGEGSTLESDDAVQAFNFRLCLTDNPDNLIPFRKPDNYDRSEYVSLIDDVLSGRNTNYTMAGITEKDMQENREIIVNGGITSIPGDRWGINKVTNMVKVPNGKRDANNQHLALISTDLPEENWPWPDASWEWRDGFAKRLKDYTLGLLWFAANDEELPTSFREAVSKWGFAADEYPENGGFPRQVYVREGRRLENSYFFTASDATPVPGKIRPPVHKTSITASHYAMDSHGVHKREPGRIHLDGFISFPSKPYTVPFGVILPKGLDNLLTPVPVSGSHIGFSTLRMEPCWMALGQAAGAAASMAIKQNLSVRNLDIRALQDILLDNGATLFYMKDVQPGDPDYKIFTFLGLDGYIPDWNVSPDDEVSQDDIKLWESLKNASLSEMPLSSRREALRWLSAK